MSTDRVLLLVAGFPGTGKSRLCTLVQERLGPFLALTLDDRKEELYDLHGFADAAARDHLDRAALEIFFAQVRTAMDDGRPLVAEYPFSEKQRAQLDAACRDYGYRPVTVRLVADFEVLYARQRRRDLDPSRHVGHLVDAYRPGDTLDDRLGAPQLLTRETFLDRYLHRGYGTFALGQVAEIDTTDFDQIDDDAVIARVTSLLERERT
ncbi:AAA family ATPase [Brachybacterium sacelli]|uniref:Kinase n=1 Tax=Brachybacterium sacelli TaxID=173364 RepID=A0ABS4WZA4_9MICO|nr:AAA family ATPase [Brachybacterium sacelli]MBP2381546.1 putative kinase [Brachybacterium sacelli]